MMSERPDPVAAPSSGTRADLPWGRLLFGEDTWPMLLVLLASGYLIYILAPEALPAIVIVVSVGLAAKIWRIRRARTAAQQEQRP